MIMSVSVEKGEYIVGELAITILTLQLLFPPLDASSQQLCWKLDVISRIRYCLINLTQDVLSAPNYMYRHLLCFSFRLFFSFCLFLFNSEGLKVRYRIATFSFGIMNVGHDIRYSSLTSALAFASAILFAAASFLAFVSSSSFNRAALSKYKVWDIRTLLMKAIDKKGTASSKI